jgi:hypothetical protein
VAYGVYVISLRAFLHALIMAYKGAALGLAAVPHDRRTGTRTRMADPKSDLRVHGNRQHPVGPSGSKNFQRDFTRPPRP